MYSLSSQFDFLEWRFLLAVIAGLFASAVGRAQWRELDFGEQALCFGLFLLELGC